MNKIKAALSAGLGIMIISGVLLAGCTNFGNSGKPASQATAQSNLMPPAAEENVSEARMTPVVRAAKAVGPAVVGITNKAVARDWFNNQVIAFEQVFYVKPAYRSTRAALYLIDTFITWAKHMNAGRIQCGTTTGINTQGCIRLYNHFGFKEHGTLLDMEL